MKWKRESLDVGAATIAGETFEGYRTEKALQLGSDFSTRRITKTHSATKQTAILLEHELPALTLVPQGKKISSVLAMSARHMGQ